MSLINSELWLALALATLLAYFNSCLLNIDAPIDQPETEN